MRALRAWTGAVACTIATMALPGTQFAQAQSTIQGDINGDGSVGFDDLMLLLANWQGNAPQSLGWGVVAPSVRAIHQLQVESLDQFGCILVLDLDADYVADLVSLPEKRRGIRSLTRPGGWPAWPPPGSAIEELMERATTDFESVERLAQQMLDALPPNPHGHQPPVIPGPPVDPPGGQGPGDDPHGTHPEPGAPPSEPPGPPEPPEPPGPGELPPDDPLPEELPDAL